MKKPKVLFICIHNSARSQMAEALLKRHCGDQFDVESAGLEPGTLNPLAVEVLKEIGIDISGKTPQSVDEVIRRGDLLAYVITVCDAASGERCPIFPGATTRLHWEFADPSSLNGPWYERLRGAREIRDLIDKTVQDWCATICQSVNEKLQSTP